MWRFGLQAVDNELDILIVLVIVKVRFISAI